MIRMHVKKSLKNAHIQITMKSKVSLHTSMVTFEDVKPLLFVDSSQSIVYNKIRLLNTIFYRQHETIAKQLNNSKN